jgi:hypothetical protein
MNKYSLSFILLTGLCAGSLSALPTSQPSSVVETLSQMADDASLQSATFDNSPVHSGSSISDMTGGHDMKLGAYNPATNPARISKVHWGRDGHDQPYDSDVIKGNDSFTRGYNKAWKAVSHFPNHLFGAIKHVFMQGPLGFVAGIVLGLGVGCPVAVGTIVVGGIAGVLNGIGNSIFNYH